MGVSLAKGQSVSLKKADGSALSKVILGLGWDPVKKGMFGGGSIDLDAGAILYSSSGDAEVVYYGNLKSKDGSVLHQGDNLTGAGEGDDEQIVIDLSQVRSDVTAVVLTINSYSSHTFDKVQNVFARVVDASSGSNEVVKYDLAESNKSTGTVIAKVTRGANGWEFAAIGEFANGRTAKDMVETGRRFI